MIKYAICEIGGKQYKLVPKIPIEVDLQDDKFVPKVLMVVDDKVKIGKPSLDEKLSIKSLRNYSGKKVRVAKFHAKANYRKVRGFRRKLTQIVLEA